MPPKKEKLPDGSVRVSFTTKDGQHKTFVRRPKEPKPRVKRTKTDAAAAAADDTGNSSNTQDTRPTDQKPVLVLHE